MPPDAASRRLVFSINSGRSGSQYLAQLLGTARDVKSWHEAPPEMTGEYLEMINRQPYEATRAQRQVKCAAIAEVLRGMEPGAVYAESNHMFIKTFFDVVVEDFKNVDVVFLRRDLASVLKSFIEMGYFSELNPNWKPWMSSPNAATAALRALGPDEEMDQFDRCIAYLLDIEARGQRFQRDFPEVPVHEARLEQLNDPDVVTAFFANLRLESTEETRALLGEKVNARPHRKAKINNPTTLEICQERLARYVERARKSGIEIPRSAAL